MVRSIGNALALDSYAVIVMILFTALAHGAAFQPITRIDLDARLVGADFNLAA